MSYKIAVASSDGINVDLSFGAAAKFFIYEVEGRDYKLASIEEFGNENAETGASVECGPEKSCGNGSGCGNGTGCGGGAENSPKLTLVGDCRSVVCTKIGFNIRKQLERRAISAFDIEIGVDEALEKITEYFYKLDRHENLRKEYKA